MEQIIADIFATVFLYCRNTGVRRIIVGDPDFFRWLFTDGAPLTALCMTIWAGRLYRWYRRDTEPKDEQETVQK